MKETLFNYILYIQFLEDQGIIKSIKLLNCDYHLLLLRHFAKPCLTVINLPLITLSGTVDSRELESSREIEKVRVIFG